MSKIPVILYTSQGHVKILSIKTGLVRLAVADRHPRLLQGQHPSQLVTAVVGSIHPAAGPVVVPGG